MQMLLKVVMVDHLANNSIIGDCQHGFRAKRSCVTNVHFVMESLENKTPVDTVYLDLSKALYMVPHRLLSDKLCETGIEGYI